MVQSRLEERICSSSRPASPTKPCTSHRMMLTKKPPSGKSNPDDCFRYRNQLGMDVVLEALRLWRERGRRKLDVLLDHARMRHVERAMRPYLEATQ